MERNRFRCHFSIVIENLGSFFWFIVVFCISQIDDFIEVVKKIDQDEAAGGDILLVSGASVLILLIVFIFHCIRWSKTWISIEEEAIVIEKRTLRRKVNTIGMKNISNINMEQNLFERIFGTCKIKLDTNSKTTADETDVKIVLKKDKAEAFKKLVMYRMNEETPEPAAEVEDKDWDVCYSIKEIIMHCIYTVSVFNMLFLIVVIIGFVIGIRSMQNGKVIMDTLVNIIGSLLAVAFAVMSVLQGIVKDFFVYYGFKVKRKENKIYLSHGFLKKRQYVLSVDKINAVKLVSPTISRLFGRQYVQLICIGVGDEENENSMLLLSETKENARKKLSLLLPEFVLEEPPIKRREKRSILLQFPGILIFDILLIIGVILAAGYNLFQISVIWVRGMIIAAGLVVVVLHMLSLYLCFRTEGIGIGEKMLAIESGSFKKVTTWVLYQKIQYMKYSQGPICRHMETAKGNIYILANILDSICGISYFRVEEFEKIHQKILKRKGK